MFVHFIKKESIAKRFIIGILIFSSCVTFLLTAVQLLFDYSRDVKLIEEKLDLVESSYGQSFSESLWVLDNQLLEVQIRGVLRIPDIQYVEITKNDKRLYHLGEEKTTNIITRSFPLTYDHRGVVKHLGTCTVNADLDRVYKRLIDKAVIILLSQGTKTFLVSIFIFFLFYHQIGKHLNTIACYTQKLDLTREQHLSLKRSGGNKTARDELYLVTESINQTVHSLRTTYRALHASNKNLQAEITERQRAEDRLMVNNSLLNAIIEGTTDVIFLKNLQGRYVLANDACLQALGRPEDEVIGRDDSELFPSGSAEIVQRVDRSVMESGKALLTEDKLETAYGDTYWLSNKSPHRDKDGKINGLIGIARDITDLKNSEKAKAELEKQLQQTQKMEALGTLAGGIAHDFNNILSIILGYSALIQEEMAPGTPGIEEIGEVIKAGERARELVAQILAFSRRGDLELTPLQPHLIIKEALKMLRASIPTTIEIRRHLPDCGHILGDPTQLHQVVVNLCTNAYHAMRDTGGFMELTLSRTELAEQDLKFLSMTSTPGPYVKLELRDTGQGIEEKKLKAIFDPYFTTKKKGEGTGLGLSIVHGIVTGFGGHISVKSKPGSGTTFTVHLPVHHSGPAPSPEESPAPIPTGSEHILVVDDEEPIIKMQKQMLETLGYRVTAFTAGLDALGALKSFPNRFNLLLTDMTMPNMTGLQLAHEIKSVGSRIPVIICSGLSDGIKKEIRNKTGIQGYVKKPIRKRELALTIRMVLDKTSGASCDNR